MREMLARSDRDFLTSDDADEAPSRMIGVLTLLLHRPLEIAGALTLTGFCVAILVNALALQSGPHPAPVLGRFEAAPEAPAVPVPPAMPQQRSGAWADATLLRAIQTELVALRLYEGTPDGLGGPRTAAAIRAFQAQAGVPADGLPSQDLLDSLRRREAGPEQPPTAATPPTRDAGDPIAALIAASTPPVRPTAPPDRRVLAVEQALASLGYGPIRVDGMMDPQTRSAISRFERDRDLPVTGDVSPRLTKELTSVSGMALP